MAAGRVYYHIVLTVARDTPVFLNDEVDAAFMVMVPIVGSRSGWRG